LTEVKGKLLFSTLNSLLLQPMRSVQLQQQLQQQFLQSGPRSNKNMGQNKPINSSSLLKQPITIL